MAGKTYKVLDLFAGAGGFSLGFKRFAHDGYNPFEIVGCVELDKFAAKTLVSSLVREGLSYEEALARVICDDITLDSTKEKIFNTCPDVDVIIGGPPCQSFSMIGPRSGCKLNRDKFAHVEINFRLKPAAFML